MRNLIREEAQKGVSEAIQEQMQKIRNDFDSSHDLGDKLLSREEAAEFLGVKGNTLAVWALQGRGPAVTKIGSRSLYRLSILKQFINDCTTPR